MPTIGERLRERWVATGLPVRPGVRPGEIDAFESKYGVFLPPDLRDYFATVDGMESDDYWLEFLRLGAVRSVPDEMADYPAFSDIVNTLPDAGQHFVIANFMLSSHFYAIRLSRENSQRTPVLWILGEHHAQIANSFTEFGERYLLEGAWALI
jgi:hypothetical protein